MVHGSSRQSARRDNSDDVSFSLLAYLCLLQHLTKQRYVFGMVLYSFENSIGKMRTLRPVFSCFCSCFGDYFLTVIIFDLNET